MNKVKSSVLIPPEQLSIINQLRSRIPDRGQSKIAEEIGVSPQFLANVLNGKRKPGEKILEWLGLGKRVSYEPLKGRGK